MGNTLERLVSIMKEGGDKYLTLVPEGAAMVCRENSGSQP